ncbi:MAG: hypothetical protein JNK21_06175 [Rhodospirillaceae bacterium]|nr:hypothetical protein [Rhodospirillaceae bacterium]
MLPQLAAFGSALVLILAVRLAAPKPHGLRLAGVGAAVGLMIGLSMIAGFSWDGAGPVSRIGHIALGAVLVGAVMDHIDEAWGRWALLTVFSLGCGWASVLGGLTPQVSPSIAALALSAAVGALWLGLMVRLSALSPHKPTSFVMIIAVAAGLTLLAAIARDDMLTRAGLCLLGALFALALVAAILSLEVNYIAMAPVAASILAIAWALSQRQPETMVGLPVLALVLFAERTARRIPMPGGRISAYLYLGGLAGCCTIPIVLAALLVSAGVSA